MQKCLVLFAVLVTMKSFSQTAYKDSMQAYLQKYVQQHEVVKGEDKSRMEFYTVNSTYRLVADLKPSTATSWIRFKTSGVQEKVFRVYGTASFQLDGKKYSLNIYQAQDLLTNAQYKNYLFLPFTDASSGIETYEGGRYIDLTINDIKNNKLVIDFNKAYNPYCAYVSGVYNCPVPPKENALPVAIKAGEKAFAVKH